MACFSPLFQNIANRRRARPASAPCPPRVAGVYPWASALASGTTSRPSTLARGRRHRAPRGGAVRNPQAYGHLEAAERRAGALERRGRLEWHHPRAAEHRVRAAATYKRAPRPSPERVAVKALAAPPDNRAVTARRANSLVIEPPGGAHRATDTPVNASRDRLTISGHSAYSLYFEGGMGCAPLPVLLQRPPTLTDSSALRRSPRGHGARSQSGYHVGM